MNDLFGGLSGLMKGLSGFMPQDDPDVKLMTAQSELSELQRKETEIYVQIAKLALENQPNQFPELESKLSQVQASIEETTEKIKSAQAEKNAKEAARVAEEQEHTCPTCSYLNPDGVKFCQECGTKLGLVTCRKCGTKLAQGTRFCGECGAKQGE